MPHIILYTPNVTRGTRKVWMALASILEHTRNTRRPARHKIISFYKKRNTRRPAARQREKNDPEPQGSLDCTWCGLLVHKLHLQLCAPSVCQLLGGSKPGANFPVHTSGHSCAREKLAAETQRYATHASVLQGSDTPQNRKRKVGSANFTVCCELMLTLACERPPIVEPPRHATILKLFSLSITDEP